MRSRIAAEIEKQAREAREAQVWEVQVSSQLYTPDGASVSYNALRGASNAAPNAAPNAPQMPPQMSPQMPPQMPPQALHP